MARKFRALYQWITPAFLHTGDGEKVLHTWSILLDAAVQRLKGGLEARFPGRAGPSALALIGADRGIPRGRDETDAHYAERLKAWRYPRGHRVRGSAFALLNQVSEYWGGIACWTIDANGTRHDRDADGTESYSYGNSWTWDTQAASNWSRFWVWVDGSDLFEEQPDLDDPDLWGGALGTPGYTIGVGGMTFEDTRAMRRLLYGRHPWRPAGTQPEWLIISLDGSEPTPAATWEHWSVQSSGTQVAVRDSAMRYISFDPAYNNVYAGYDDRFCDDMTLPDGTTEAGDDTSFPTTITLPDGTTYAGDDTSFPATIQLVDDGDLPQ